MYRDVFAERGGDRLEHRGRAPLRVVALRTCAPVVEDVVGCGVDLPEGEAITEEPERLPDAPDGRESLPPHLEGPANAFRRRHRVHEPFVLYGGRIDPGKGCEELLEYFQTYVREGGDATLMLMGVKLMPIPEDPHVRFAGTLPDEERLHALEAATVVVVPSPHESLSLLALEAMAVGTPVLVNARSEVLVDHCRQSNAGLYYADRWEFTEALKLLDAGRGPARGAGPQRQALRQPALPVEQHSAEVRTAVRAHRRAGSRDAAPRERERPREPDHDGRIETGRGSVGDGKLSICPLHPLLHHEG